VEFFPLTLGLPKPRPPPRERDETEPHLPRRARDEEAWRESLSAPPEEVEEHPEAAVLARLRASPPPRPWVILGEPGAGKTRLLEHWHATWLRDLGAPRLGMAVPVLVRLREVAAATLREPPEVMADRLWDHALATGEAEAKGFASASVFDRPRRLVTPVWLLDGLDELAGHPGDAGLWAKLRALPGAVVLTCRTAVFQQVQREVAGWHAPPWRILGLKPGDEQTAYLRLALEADGKDPARAPDLIRALNDNAALRPLAAIPLLLSLVAEVCDDVERLANRAAFYATATCTLWQRKLADRPELLDLDADRDRALAALAETMGVATIEAEKSALRNAGISGPLREALRISGLLTFDARRERVLFPHLTFQEFHLARAWLARPLRKVLDAHWADPRAEEVLGLLLALHDSAGRGAKAEAVLLAFVTEWRQRHRAGAAVLWRIGRSPMRVALRLIGRAGIALRDPVLGAAAAPVPVRLAIARMRGAAPAALAALARDADAGVRWGVASNAATPPATLAALATDAAAFVRRGVAENPATPPDTLADLAKDVRADVRRGVAWNAATPPATLAALARDADAGVRQGVARNPATPPDTLAALATDVRAFVRRAVASNAVTPPDTLAALASDADADLRWHVARNATTPPATLAALAKDPDAVVRRGVARNATTPPATLAALATDADTDVRWAVAWNAATPPDTLAALAGDAAADVRQGVAWNAATPPATLATLARDADADVRQCVARNEATPPDTLAALARDADADLRRAVAQNPSTLLEDLYLSDD
jgi:hypothetical protein